MIHNTLAKAKACLILDNPFFASILLSMPITENPDVPTMATDGESIQYNPKFLDELSLSEVIFVLAHETLHAVFEHTYTIGNKDPELWNEATDYVINELLVSERLGVMPKAGLKDSALVAKGGGTAEGVYKILPPKPKSKDPKDGKNGKGKNKGEWTCKLSAPSKDPAELSQKRAEGKIKIIQARNAAKMMGKLSAGLERLVEDATRSKTDWKAALRRFLSERAKSDLSYARPKRRFLAEDINLPSLIGEKLGRIEIAVDCSGSINEKVLGEFEKEIQGIIEDACPTEISVTYFDSEVLKREKFTSEEHVKLNPVGGGGTAFSPVFEAINKDETPPIACVVLTDLCCSDFGPTPNYPVLWACTTKLDKVPFGEVISLESQDHL